MKDDHKDSLMTTIKAFFCMLHTSWFIDTLLEVDFKKSLKSNQQLREASSEQQNKHKAEEKNLIKFRAILLRKKLMTSLLWIFLGIFIAIVVAMFGWGKSISFQQWLGILSICIFSFATLARLGWEGQSIKGYTVIEQLDKRIFWFLYLSGTILGCLALIW